MPAPVLADVTAYLDSIDSSHTHLPATVAGALAAEKAAQAHRCRVPTDVEEWPADLAEALCRRVARNLGVRPLVLGFVPSVDPTAGASYINANDPEIRRLEAPYRKLVKG